MVKADNEFKMNLTHAVDEERERPFFTGASQRRCLREATRGVVCLVPACSDVRVYQRKGREDSTSSARPVNQSNSAEFVEKCPPTTRHKVKKCSDDCRSRVRSCRRATNNSQEEIGVMNQESSMAEQDHGARSQGRRERRWSDCPWKQGLTTT